MNWNRTQRRLGALIALTCAIGISTPASAYDWIGADLATWNSLPNWTPNPLDALNIGGSVIIHSNNATINRCVLDEPGNTAAVSGTISVQGDTGAASDNQRLFIQSSTTLDCAGFVEILDHGMLVAEGGSALKAGDYVLVLPDFGGSASLFLRDSALRTPLLDNVGLVQAEQTSTIEHAIGGNPMQFNNHFPGSFDVECGADVLVDGNFDNKTLGGGDKAIVNVANGATLTITGNLINDGVWNVGADCGMIQAAHILLFGTAAWNGGADLNVIGGGVIEAQNFDCAIVDIAWADPGEEDSAGRLNLADGAIHIVPSPVAGIESSIEQTCYNEGGGVNLDGAEAPVGTIGELRIFPGPFPARLVDDRDNTGQGVPEVSYVRNLILEPGVTLDLNGGTIYYGSVSPADPYDPGSGVTIIGDGVLAQIETTAVAETAASGALELHGASPNPFNPRTSIRFATASSGAVKLAIYDVSGRIVRVLIDESLAAGEHGVDWDGGDDAGRGAKSGVYFYSVESGGEKRSGRVTLLK